MPSLGSAGRPTRPACFSSTASGDSGTLTLRDAQATVSLCSSDELSVTAVGLSKPQMRCSFLGSCRLQVQMSASPLGCWYRGAIGPGTSDDRVATKRSQANSRTTEIGIGFSESAVAWWNVEKEWKETGLFETVMCEASLCPVTIGENVASVGPHCYGTWPVFVPQVSCGYRSHFSGASTPGQSNVIAAPSLTLGKHQ